MILKNSKKMVTFLSEIFKSINYIYNLSYILTLKKELIYVQGNIKLKYFFILF